MTMQGTAGRLRRPPARGDDGFALLTVLGAMVVVTLFLFSSLAYALSNSAPSREDQDAKAALAAAQAGIQEFASRMALDDTYYANNGNAHANNKAFTQEVTVPGSSGAAASYTYQLLTDAIAIGKDGVIRLKVTGCSRAAKVAATTLAPKPCQDGGGVTRDLVAEFRPDGFLRYIYLTDLEVADPALFTAWPVAEGTEGQTSKWVPGAGNKGTQITWEATPALLQSACRRYYYAGRHQTKYLEGQYVEVQQPMKYEGNPKTWQNDGAETRITKTATATTPIFLGCPEVRFTGDDLLSGPAHSNDAMQITGLVDFTKKVTSGWPATAPALDPGRTFLTPPTDGKFWWGDKSLTLPHEKPGPAASIPLPINNLELRAVADPAQPNPPPGCLYTGQTRIRFSGNKMRVLSPATTSSSTPARCYNTGTPGVEQLLDIPPVIYVQDGVCGPTESIGYPVVGEAQQAQHLWLPTVKYGCGRGHAFVSGSLSGRVTIGTAQDIVITGDTTYQGGMTGSDALGLIPRGHAWVYHPVTDGGSTSCTPQPECRFVNTSGVTPVRRIDAAILSVAGSFLAQNWYLGAALSTEGAETGCEPQNVGTMTCTKLTVRGSIIQKYRGGVGSPATTTPVVRPRAGYLKNYLYDSRLLNSPPPFFLQPRESWRLDKTMD